ncbi:MAG: FIST N-terminal domain-containing protein [Planctomycetota bacterium]|nr:FIST N-terminal domain-containing protein [Planctomycetota bacterium]
MKCTSIIQRIPVSNASILEEIAVNLEGDAPDLCAIFFSGDPLDEETVGKLLTDLRTRWPQAQIFGCHAESIVCNAQEWEETAAVTVWAATMPGVHFHAYPLQFESTAEGPAFVGWPDLSSFDWESTRGLLAIADPFSFPMDALLERMNEDRPNIPIAGGLASGADQPGENRLWLNETVQSSGAIMIQLQGDLEVETLVSQGCRPIGDPMVITRVERNAILELGGRPSLEVLQELFLSLPTSEQQLLQQGLLLGRFIVESGDRNKGMGEFLVRSVVGIDPDLKAIVIGDYFRPGQSVQFHLRDEASADHDLSQRLASHSVEPPPSAGMLFTCNGRGTRMFNLPHHDAAAIAHRFPEIPLTGFFAAGEIGPVGHANFVHGFTVSAIFFRPSEVSK